MRRFHRRQLLENINILREAGNALNGQSGENKINLCADIQEFIAAVLNFLDSVAGDDALLTDGFVQLYRMLLKVSQDEISSQQLVVQIDEMKGYVESKAETDKLEMAFLCYKASMSDCLESVYLAAKEDAGCDAYFIPIPYFDRTPEGTIGQMHCEAEGCYSDRILLTDWKTYRIQERHPDVIFIMNPYDEYNYITTVHPDFYASRLKDQTELLVYIPYYIHEESIDPIVGCLPGVLWADKVMVQSEKVREQYVSSMIREGKGITPETAGKKIEALGSPKTDNVITRKAEDYEIPKAWQRLLTPDGGKKKWVALYNLSVSCALAHSMEEKQQCYLDKLRHVLGFFRTRNDVILWLRPHPLLGETFASVQPKMHEEYQNIIREYQEWGGGIYDDSAQLNRAVAWADACYGDSSSVNLLFQFVGKPVLLQRVEDASEEFAVRKTRQQVKEQMELLIGDRERYHYFIYGEASADGQKGEFALADFVEYMDVIREYGPAQSARYRACYANADATAGQKIYEYVKNLK